MEFETRTIMIDDWVLRIRESEGDGPHPVTLLLHGWTGDENSMWIFASRLPENYLLIAPRGLHEAPIGGYSWHPIKDKSRPTIDDWSITPRADFSDLRLAGFSQGAALAYAYALLHPERVRALAGLAGFLPEGASVSVWGYPFMFPMAAKRSALLVGAMRTTPASSTVGCPVVQIASPAIRTIPTTTRLTYWRRPWQRDRPNKLLWI
ncbi:MAG: hypothetical protein ISS57_01940 [Anaerolineales bacterium]|nr:hypothetical protein [Anaerolineales bacterium]